VTLPRGILEQRERLEQLRAVEAGMRILQHGGNAVDAGVATILAASVIEFSHFSFGGEVPILIKLRSSEVAVVEGMGAAREVSYAVLAEAAIIAAVLSLSVQTGLMARCSISSQKRTTSKLASGYGNSSVSTLKVSNS